MGDSPAALKDRLAEVRAQIPPGVRLVAVSKRQPLWKIEAAYDAGQRDFGENYAQELSDKRNELKLLCPEARWHFIGRVQRNKAKELRLSDLIHGVGALRHAQALAGRPPAKILLQVNSSDEDSKNGFQVKQLRAEFGALSKVQGVSIEGLMTMPAPEVDPRPAFRSLAALARELGLKELSMGMSGDFPIAIEEGATLVRVGTAIFGARENG